MNMKGPNTLPSIQSGIEYSQQDQTQILDHILYQGWHIGGILPITDMPMYICHILPILFCIGRY